jgi:thiol-disulfide isomerase/thioredoxin
MTKASLSTALLVMLTTISVATTPAMAEPQYGSKPRSGNTAPPSAPATKDPDAKADGPAIPTAEAKFYAPLDKADRAALKEHEGWMIPKPTADLVWVGGEAMDRAAFRDKVTVIQSVGGKSSPRAALEKVKRSIPEGVILVGLHTPDQADRADDILAKDSPCLVAIDASGDWCDALGVWKKPVNIVIDKTGAVRYVGLSDVGLKAKLPALLAEEVDESVEAREKPDAMGAPGADDAKPAADVKWPEFLAPIDPKSAGDKRGKKIPGFTVAKWLGQRPDPGIRLVAIDFWATWCGPCRAAIPHVNELTEKYGQDILFVGISDEKEAEFTAGMKKQKLKAGDFKYPLAIDPAATLKEKFFGIRGIPHMAIFSADGIVRWQGHPMSLQEEDIDKLVAANRANTKPAAATGAKGGRGWAGSTADQKSR